MAKNKRRFDDYLDLTLANTEGEPILVSNVEGGFGFLAMDFNNDCEGTLQLEATAFLKDDDTLWVPIASNIVSLGNTTASFSILAATAEAYRIQWNRVSGSGTLLLDSYFASSFRS